MALISWKQISPDLLSYGKLTGSLEVSGSIVADGDLLPAEAAQFDIGSTAKPWRDLYLHTASLKFVREGTVISTIVGEADSIKIGNIRITTSSIDVVNNVAYVSGIAESEKEILLVTKIIQNARFVTEVQNFIKLTQDIR